MAGDVELYSLMNNGIWNTITAVSDRNGSRVAGSHRVVLYVYAQLGAFAHFAKAASIVLERNSVSASSSSHEQRLAFNSPTPWGMYMCLFTICVCMHSHVFIQHQIHQNVKACSPSKSGALYYNHCHDFWSLRTLGCSYEPFIRSNYRKYSAQAETAPIARSMNEPGERNIEPASFDCAAPPIPLLRACERLLRAS